MIDKKNNAVEKVENIANKYKKQEQKNADSRIKIARLKMQEKELKNQVNDNKQNEKTKKRIKGQIKNEKQKLKSANGKKKSGLIYAVVSLGIATLVLASVLTFNFLMPSKSDKALESEYRKSFYDTAEQVDNIDLNMSKIIVSKDRSAVQTYLTDLAINSELCERDLQSLPLEDESKFYTTKLINQIGDYAKYLNKKLAYEQDITEQDLALLKQLYKSNLALKDSLQKTISQMDDDFSFISMNKENAENIVLQNFDELQNLSENFPELIYDGPFSDGLNDREIKGLSKNEIDDAKAKENFISIFNEYNLKNVREEGALDSQIECYNFTSEVNGLPLFAEISKRDGKLLMFSYAGSCEKVNYTDEDAVNSALNFIDKNGIKDLKAVWINLANNVYTINFAGVLEDAIVYSDMVKVRVCAETNMVIGYDATAYYLNHTDRETYTISVSENEALKKVSSNIDVKSTRLAIIPIGKSSEKICYEFAGEYDGTTYYVYIDANTGKQVEMFKVIESTEGQLLM
ncbi:MAG: germination protein YpeB [Clostridia bacterium]|nr:germination protein YpeB [Clostridia bacterium]